MSGTVAVDVQAAAREYIARGWEVVPLAPKDKAPTAKGWMELKFQPEDFRPGDNIGIRSVNGLVDIDPDADEVRNIINEFLPPTGAVYGRGPWPRLRFLYKSTFDKRIVFKDLGAADEKKAGLIEIRVNHQSMAPPSIHPDTGEVIAWHGGKPGVPAEVEPSVLLRAVRLAATTGLIIRYYGVPGSRHDWCLALAGFLRRLGLTEEEALKVVGLAAASSKDDDPKNRLDTVKSTYDRGDDEPTTGAKTLTELTVKGKEFVASLGGIWGSDGGIFLTDEKDRIRRDSQENIRRALKKLGASLSYDTFNQRIVVTDGNGPRVLDDEVRNRLWLAIDEKFRFRPNAEFFDVVLKDLAAQNKVHPVCAYLDGLTWDGTPRLDTWLVRLAKAADTEYVRTVSSIVAIAAVRRVRRPACKFDEMLVLESDQGLNKSSALRALCPNEEWFSDDLPLNLDAKEVIERTAGRWIIEAAELSGMHRSRIEHLKAMLSRQVDGPVRMAYARLPISRQRQFVIVGTTNDHAYLQDATGNRRFWPVRVERFDIDGLLGERDQLWAEGAHREAKGESIRMPERLYTVAGLQQERRRVEDPWEALLAPVFGPEASTYMRVVPKVVWEALGMPFASQQTPEAQQRVNKIMQQWGYRRATVKTGGMAVKGWARGTANDKHAEQQSLPDADPGSGVAGDEDNGF
jgi:hypothetical protein